MSRHITMMGLEDAPHYSPEQREAILAKYPAHERDARTKGYPRLGEGAVFPISVDAILVDPHRDFPPWAIVIGGLDFGWDHPTAACKIVYEPEEDVITVTRCYRKKQATPAQHALTLRTWGPWLPWAWPHDGLQHDNGSGLQLAGQFRDAGLNMLPERATFEDGTNGLEAGVSEMLQRMQTGRWKVFRTCPEWIAEFHTYHREDGKIVDEIDDLLCASRYAMMMRRYAVKPAGGAAAAKPVLISY